MDIEVDDVNDVFGEENKEDEESTRSHIIAQFFTTDDQPTGTKLDLPLNITADQLQLLINQILGNEEPYPYAFYINDEQIIGSVNDLMEKQEVSKEEILKIVYQAEAIFRVRAVSRCTSSMEGHTDSVLSVCFSPNGEDLASGSGDKTVRLWDLETQTPKHTLSGHRGWILCLTWSPLGDKLASGAMDNEIRIWSKEGKELCLLKGHSKWITSLCWQPLHRDNRGSRKIVSASKDGTAKVWDVVTARLMFTLCGHSQAVTSVKWSGGGFIFTASQDRTINMYTEAEGKLIKTLKGHAHWVNSLALSSDYVLRTGPYDHKTTSFDSLEEAYQAAVTKYNLHFQNKKEKLVSGSDDFTLFIWDPENSKKPLSRLHGHQQVINQVLFSPDGNFFATASFDKSIKLYGADGKFITTFRGHVGSVYQIAWSCDSRMLVSASKDSTVKVWEIRTKKLLQDLPGHADEVFAIDWAPDGQTVCTGSRDRLLKLWRF